MCTERHPEHLDWAPCVANAENHAMCQFFGPNGEAVIWPNPSYVPVEHTTKSQRSQVLKGAETAVREQRREDKRAARSMAASEIGDDGLSFDGETYDEEFDLERLGAQSKRVFTLMADSEYRTLAEIGAVTNDPEASISARLRDYRKPKFGSHIVNRRRRGDPKNGVWEFQLVPQSSASPDAPPRPMAL